VRQQAVVLHSISDVPVNGRIVHRMGPLGYLPWSGSCQRCTKEATPSPT
jgi:hypothetical protein